MVDVGINRRIEEWMGTWMDKMVALPVGKQRIGERTDGGWMYECVLHNV